MKSYFLIDFIIIKMVIRSCFYCFLLFVLISCQEKGVRIEEISTIEKDYIHIPQTSSVFRALDSLKYNEEYWHACKAYEQLLTNEESLNEADRYYLWNQLCYLYLKTYQLNKVDHLLNRFGNTQDLSQEILADLFYNKGVYILNIEGDKTRAITHLNNAEKLYEGIYGTAHFKRLETLMSIAAYYDESIILDSLDFCLDDIKKLLDSNTELDKYAKEYYYIKSKALQYDKNHRDCLVDVDIAIGKAKKGTIDTIFLAKCYILRSHLLRKLDKNALSSQTLIKAMQLTKTMSRHPQTFLSLYEDLALQAMGGKEDSILFYAVIDTINQRFDCFPNALKHPDCLLAYYQFNIGNYTEAILLYEGLLKEYEWQRASNKRFFDEAYFVLCKMYTHNKDFDRAYHYNQLALQNLIGDRPDMMEALIKKDYLSGFAPEFRHALSIYLSNMPILLYEKYKLDTSNLNNLKDAVASFIVLDSLFFSYSQIKEESALLEFAEEHFNSTYDIAIQVCIDAYENFGDFEFLENAHVFIERVKYAGMYRGVIRKKLIKSLPDSLSGKIQLLETEIKELHRRKFSTLGKEQQFVDKRIALQETQLNTIIRKAQELFPTSFVTNNSTIIPKLRSIQNYATVPIVQQYISDKTVYHIVIRKDSIFVESHAKAKDLEKMAAEYLKVISDLGNAYRANKYQKCLNLGSLLYNSLMQPLVNCLGKSESFVLCSDANFSRIPYESLVTKPSKPSDETISYLVNKYNVFYTYSLKTYVINQIDRQDSFEQAQILGYAYSDKNSKRQALQPLPGSYKDLEAIASNFKALDLTLRFEREANLPSFRRDINQTYDIIHLGLHATSDDSIPYNNQIFFQDPRKNKKVDTLFSSEIEYLPLSCQLMVLSACETATGTSLIAEGVYSLARSCFIAGAKQVIASLWNAQDDVTSTVLASFYGYLSKGYDIHYSLYLAKLDFLNEATRPPELSFPGFWAGLVLLQ
ncbi:MAG: CHAT domain-containing protein [Chitinophagales bacterium]|nr:CHAT domain-containing protein [Chitinophagales bacterium]